METKPSASLTNGKATRSRGREVPEKPQRRRFTTEEKLRILRDIDACVPGTVGALLRREGIYSSHVAAWKQARVRGDLDPGSLRKRARRKNGDEVSRQRIADLERENRRLTRRLERAELILEIQKKAQGLFRELESPENTDSEQ